MGAFNKMALDILYYKQSGRTIEDTYIYFKDYISFEDLVSVWEGV